MLSEAEPKPLPDQVVWLINQKEERGVLIKSPSVCAESVHPLMLKMGCHPVSSFVMLEVEEALGIPASMADYAD